ncbi:cytoplasmic protein [Nonomuraea basaltis]|uniref:cytoplasmic protein n=1 Tax=Nonomuraea basaltis TaxID=2495887 RepID=UPI00110C4E72|nr:cytoplasmic protein [Nonomuraea basaltis]TMR88736.1 cytoplasmic protein [Nonomuraea basaltis]
MDQDPTTTNPDLYKLIFENERIRVLEYKDKPGDKTTPHRHPDSVMYTLGSFKRRVAAGARQVDVELQSGQVRWVGAQEHSGENVGDTDTHAIFVELKEPLASGSPTPGSPLGPSTT